MFFTLRGRTFEVWSGDGTYELVWYREEGGVAYLGSIHSALAYARRVAFFCDLAGV